MLTYQSKKKINLNCKEKQILTSDGTYYYYLLNTFHSTSPDGTTTNDSIRSTSVVDDRLIFKITKKNITKEPILKSCKINSIGTTATAGLIDVNTNYNTNYTITGEELRKFSEESIKLSTKSTDSLVAFSTFLKCYRAAQVSLSLHLGGSPNLSSSQCFAVDDLLIIHTENDTILVLPTVISRSTITAEIVDTSADT